MIGAPGDLVSSMSTPILAVFVLCALVIAWVYALYPLLLLLIAAVRPGARVSAMTDDELPTVTLLIPAYNEEAVIGDKLENSLALDYPRHKLEIVAVSDLSSDGTDGIIQKYVDRGVRYLRNERQRGKIATLSDLATSSEADIILITDANAFFERGSLRRLVSHFRDPKVGMVTGNKILKRSATAVGEGEGAYQTYETLVRRAESDVFSVSFVTGAMTAIRRDLFVPLPDYLEFDHVLPLHVVNRGFRVVFAEDAPFSEDTAPHARAEFRVRVRNATRGFTMVLHMGEYLNARKHPWYAFHIYSRKIVRWLIAVPTIGLLLTNLALLDNPIFRLLLVAQLAFYLVALIGYVADRRGSRAGMLGLPFYFCLVNFASIVGFARALRGERIAVWRTGR